MAEVERFVESHSLALRAKGIEGFSEEQLDDYFEQVITGLKAPASPRAEDELKKLFARALFEADQRDENLSKSYLEHAECMLRDESDTSGAPHPVVVLGATICGVQVDMHQGSAPIFTKV